MSPPESTLDRIAALADEMKLANLQPQIAACRELLHQRNGIDVAVFGRFKAGKSSFLNHLTGRAVLPIGVVPLTAVITRLRYGERERAEVHFLNGTTKNIPLEDIGLYVGENENPNNQKQVASVEVELPELKPLAPLQFVDTPGLGSAFTHNTEVAMNWLPHVGAALVAVSSDAPLSERDLALLEELRRHTPKIVLLLTKADLLTEPQRAEVLAFVQSQLRRKWNGDLPVFFYSILPGLPELKTRLQLDLLGPLLRNRAETTGQIARHKLGSLVSQTLNYLRIALAAATQAESAREALCEKLADERRQFDLLRSELAVLSREWSANALDLSLGRLQPTQAVLQGKIRTALRDQFPRWKLRLPRLLAAWREWLGVFLKRELSEVSREQQAMFCEPLRQTQQHLTRTLRAFHDRLAGHVNVALGLSLTPRQFALEIREPSAPPVDVAYAFDAAFSAVGWLIPLRLFRKPIERVLLRKARYEVEKNLSRLAAAWRDRVAASINELVRQAEQQGLEELTALENSLAQTKSGVTELRATIVELEAALRVKR
jgi:GTP-binding protein EngB required for normal cell division